MGQLKPLPAKLNRREVPKQLKDFEQRRQDYNSSLSEIRRQFQSEWSERRKREEAAAEAYRAEVAAGKRQRDAVKALKRTSIVATEAAASAQRAAISAARRQEGVSRELARQVDITAMRRRWLDRLEADSAGWIREDAIDTAITPELFGLKYAWQVSEGRVIGLRVMCDAASMARVLLTVDLLLLWRVAPSLVFRLSWPCCHGWLNADGAEHASPHHHAVLSVLWRAAYKSHLPSPPPTSSSTSSLCAAVRALVRGEGKQAAVARGRTARQETWPAAAGSHPGAGRQRVRGGLGERREW